MSDLPNPDERELRRLHQELCIGDDPNVPTLFAELVIPPLRRRFRRKAGADVDAVDSLIDMSVARYLAEPHRYDPGRGPLLAFLWRDIDGDRKNELESLAARRRHEIPDSDAVELRCSDWNLSAEEEALDELDPFDLPKPLSDAALAEVAAFSAQDQQLVALLVSGVRETSAYVQVLGIEYLPPNEQKRTVKRHKDRLTKRLEAIGDRLGRST